MGVLAVLMIGLMFIASFSLGVVVGYCVGKDDV